MPTRPQNRAPRPAAPQTSGLGATGIVKVGLAGLILVLLTDMFGPMQGWIRRISASPQPRRPGVTYVEGSAPGRAPSAVRRVPQPAYDFTPAPTPVVAKSVLKEFASWLERQHRSVGGKIADSMYAKAGNGRLVVFLQVNPEFMAQDFDTRLLLAESIQEYWAERCATLRLCGRRDAHAVFLDPDGSRIVGGSRPENATEVWMR